MLITQRNAVLKSYERYTSNLTRPIGLYGTPTGHFVLDMILGGWVPTKVNTVAGRSGHGKSGLVTQILESAGVVVNGARTEVVMYSWEMESSFIADRHVCYKVGITLPQLRYSRILSQVTRDQITKTYAEAAKFPINYHHYSSNIEAVLKQNTEWLEDVKKKEQMEGIKIQPLMILDFVGMTQGNAKYGGRTYDIGDFLQKLKQYCNDTGLCVLLLAQVNRGADSKEYPDVTDISDSQFIEQNSDTLIILDRPHYRRKETMKDFETGQEIPSIGKALFKVVKNREGEVKDYITNCDIAKFRFWDRDMVFGEDYTQLYKEERFWVNRLK